MTADDGAAAAAAAAAQKSDDGPSTYELRILGLIPADVRSALGDVATESASVSTVLSRAFVDQAQLLAFVSLLGALGLEILEVHRLEDDRLDDAPDVTDLR